MRFTLAAAALAVAGAQYQPSWASLDTRPLPAWYDDVKFGIFIHWGVFSVPSWGDSSNQEGGASGEWFWWQWQGDKNPDYTAFVNSTQKPGWTYPDYAPGFTAELWDPQEWAQLFAASGAKYVVLTSKHHEGFCNWPSATSFNWNSMDVGPHRDLVGDLATAVEAAGLHWGLYHSLFEWFNPLYLSDKASNWSTHTFRDKTFSELTDLVQRYQPEVIWSDGDWEAPDSYWNAPAFLSWLANESPVKDTVVWNDRWGSGDTCAHGSYYTCTDRYDPQTKQGHKWENALTIDQYSWGWRRNAKYSDFLTTDYFVDTLVQTVACGGNMLLNIGPASDGTISPVFADRLTGIGAWLKVNGEAIYSTVPWRAQNDTAASVWYTLNNSTGAVYATTTAWPATNTLVLTVPVPTASTAVAMLGYAGAVTWAPGPGGKGITITMPALNPATLPCDNAWAFKLTAVQ